MGTLQRILMFKLVI